MRKMIKIILLVLAAIVVSFGIYLSMLLRHYTVPILMYHYVNSQEAQKSRLGVSPETFLQQMCFLRVHKYNVLPLKDIVELIKAKKPIPPKTVAITFDDGYSDNFTNAYPVLQKYHLPATIFVVIDRIGMRLGNDDYMDWPQLEEMSSNDLVEIGSHTLTHRNLSEVQSDEELIPEIFESKKIIEEKLAKEVKFFSYPYGGISPRAKELVEQAGYLGAVGTNFAKNSPGKDIYALKRLRISENCKNMFIFWAEISGFYTFIKEQRDSY